MTAMPDDFRDLVEALESNELSAVINTASGYRLALQIARHHPQTRELVQRLLSDPTAIGHLINWLQRTSTQAIDPRFESPSDTAMFVALVALDASNSAFIRYAAQVIRQAPQTWWSARAAQAVLSTGALVPRSKSSTDSWETLRLGDFAWTIEKNASSQDAMPLVTLRGDANAVSAKVETVTTVIDQARASLVMKTAATIALALPFVGQLRLNTEDTVLVQPIRLQRPS